MATGTADIAIMLSNIKNCEIIGLDISSKMIEIGKTKINRLNLYKKISLDIGDAENIKYADDSFDIVTVGYGVRNFENLNKGLNEGEIMNKKNKKEETKVENDEKKLLKYDKIRNICIISNGY